MEIKITYCSVWNYRPRAAGLADLIKETLGVTPTLDPGSNGVYDIFANGQPLYSKDKTGEFPENQKILDLLKDLT